MLPFTLATLFRSFCRHIYIELCLKMEGASQTLKQYCEPADFGDTARDPVVFSAVLLRIEFLRCIVPHFDVAIGHSQQSTPGEDGGYLNKIKNFISFGRARGICASECLSHSECWEANEHELEHIQMGIISVTMAMSWHCLRFVRVPYPAWPCVRYGAGDPS